MRAPLPDTTFRDIAERWAKFATLPKENLVDIWTPLESPSIRLRQFIDDKNLQKELFPKKQPLFIEINAVGLEDFSFSDLQKHVQILLHLDHLEDFSLETYLMKNNQPLVLFLVAFDELFTKNTNNLLQRLSLFTEKYPQLTLIFFTTQDIQQTNFYQSLSKHHFQNIAYQPLYSKSDSLHFLKHMQEQWDMKIPAELNKKLADCLQGHLLLLKAAVRLLRDNPQMSLEEILSAPAMKRRGIAIFQGLSRKDQETVVLLLKGKVVKSISEYLQNTGLAKDKHIAFPYWGYIKNELLKQFQADNNVSLYNLDTYFTSIEREVFDVLMESKIISREMLAKALWRNEWMERYSNWAIDQTIHRIREKLKKTGAPYEIVTKKGEGFYLKNI